MKTFKTALFIVMMICISSYSIMGQATTGTDTKTQNPAAGIKSLPTQAEITADSIAATDSFQVADAMPKILKKGNFDHIKVDAKNIIGEGAITVKMLVNRRGEVVKVMVTKADSGLQIQKEEFTKGMMNCKFDPATLNGKPIPAWVSLSVFIKTPPSETAIKMGNRPNKK